MANKDNVIYITEIVTGFENALTKETIRSLYNDYKQYITKYNCNINKVITDVKTARHYHQKPVSLDVFKNSHLRSVIIGKLMNSSYSTYFKDLSTDDMITIIGHPITKDAIAKMEYKIYRLLTRKEYRERFKDIRVALEALREIEYSLQMRH